LHSCGRAKTAGSSFCRCNHAPRSANPSAFCGLGS
jgi:hypothetical protein